MGQFCLQGGKTHTMQGETELIYSSNQYTENLITKWSNSFQFDFGICLLTFHKDLDLKTDSVYVEYLLFQYLWVYPGDLGNLT